MQKTTHPILKFLLLFINFIKNGKFHFKRVGGSWYIVIELYFRKIAKEIFKILILIFIGFSLNCRV